MVGLALVLVEEAKVTGGVVVYEELVVCVVSEDGLLVSVWVPRKVEGVSIKGGFMDLFVPYRPPSK